MMAGRGVVLLMLVLAMSLLLVHDTEGKKKAGKLAKKALKRRMHTVVKDLQNNVTALWTEVKQLGQPVHVHLHGDGHVMDAGHHHHDEDDDHGSLKTPDDYDDKGHDEKGHGKDHDHKHHGHSSHHEHHDDKDHMKSHHSQEDMMKKMKMMMKKSGHDHSLGEEEDDDDEGWDEKYMRKKHGGTHVHIHLHTGTEESGMDSDHLHALPSRPHEYRYARCDVVANSALPFMDRQNIKGTIFFRQMPNKHLEAKGSLEGFKVKSAMDVKDHGQLHGLHGHEFGDLSNGCNSLGGHMNPFGVSHGGPSAEHRHIGDFGNVEVMEDGTAKASFTDDVASLFGSDSILGRSIVIHAGPDDLGKGHSAASRASGSAGDRIACCVIAACPEPAGIWSSQNH